MGTHLGVLGLRRAWVAVLCTTSALQAQNAPNPLAFLEVPEPTPLPGPSTVTRLLFENPLPVTLVLVVFAFVLYVVLNARGRFKHGLIAAGGCALLAGGLWITAALVRTDHERMRDATRDLVDAVATANLGALDSALASDARLSGVPTLNEMGRAAIIAAVDTQLGPNGGLAVAKYSIQEIQTAIDGPDSGRVQVRVRVEVKQMGYPNVSWWGLGLSRGQDGIWRTSSIRALAIRGVS